MDGEEKYELQERSLGFRWFFCFLLFTQFGIFRGEGRRAIFLFDEPASNLHSTAQLKLLASLPRVSGKGNVVIYSTHSHYMIQPFWLEQAYIVRNLALDYEDLGADGDYFSGRPTQITIQGYRDFVGQNPNQTAYFQPALDCLDYRVSPLISTKNCMIVEGKQDFYAMKYLLPALGFSEFDILPGAGAGSMATLISLFLGWGRRFFVLLDDDKTGRKEKERYVSEYLLGPREVGTFADAQAKFSGLELENLFSDELADKVMHHFSLTTKPKKT